MVMTYSMRRYSFTQSPASQTVRKADEIVTSFSIGPYAFLDPVHTLMFPIYNRTSGGEHNTAVKGVCDMFTWFGDSYCLRVAMRQVT